MKLPDPVRKPLWRASVAVARAPARLGASKRPLPDFCIVGTQRGGTTSLHRYLVQHPGVLPARLTKGVHWFDQAFDKPESWYRANFPTEAQRAKAAEALGYEPVTGKSSPYYMFHPYVPERMASVMPGARLVVVLRDPVTRAWSHYQHNVARDMEPLGFAAALDAEPDRLAGAGERLRRPGYVDLGHRRGSYVARGRYLEQLERIWAHYPAEQVLIVFSADLDRDPAAVLERVESFLGLPPGPTPPKARWNQQAPAELPDGTAERLAEAFAEPDRGLAERLGTALPWHDR